MTKRTAWIGLMIYDLCYGFLDCFCCDVVDDHEVIT